MDEAARKERRDRIVKQAFQYRDALLTHAFVMLRDWTKAEDVVQDAFLVVMEKWEDFQEDTSVYAWVRQIVHFKAKEMHRRQAREVPVEQDQLLATISKAVEDHLDTEMAEHQRVLRKALEHCMGKLDKKVLELFVGFYWRSQSCEALSAVHNRSPNAIRLILSRRRKQLRDCVDQRLGTAGTL